MGGKDQTLLEETIEVLKDAGYGPTNVKWCGNHEAWFTWDQFAAVAGLYYDDGYGSAEIKMNLKIVGKDWWLERHEYDGSEWWEFKKLPVRPRKHVVPDVEFLKE